MLPSYDVEFLIASGGMGAVYKGMQKDLDREVAIKILPPEAGNDAESMAQFRSEARAMAKLNHNNIVSIYDFGAVQGQCYFVMEYVEGKSVHEMIIDGVVTPEMASNLMAQVCDALSYAHSKGIIHGDIKPSNIVVNGDGTVKLLDFGLARLMEQDQSDTDVEWVPMGTPEYAAPELYERGAVADPRTDIYALGVVFYEMLMRTVPQGTFALPGTTMRLDGRVDDIIVRCLRPEPENRFQSASEIRQVLDDIRTGKPLVPVAPDAARHAQTYRPGALPSQKRPRAAVPTGSGNMRRISQYGEKKSKSPVGMIVGVAVAAVAGFAAYHQFGGVKPPATTTSAVISPEAKKPEVKDEPSGVFPDPNKTANEAPKETLPSAADPKDVTSTMQEKPPGENGVPPTPPDTNPKPAPPPAVVVDNVAGVTRLKTEFTERYKLEVQTLLQNGLRDVADKYNAALTKLEQGFMSKADAGAVLQIRKEKDRFAKTQVAAKGGDVSTNPQVADYQKKLELALENLKKTSAVPIAKLNKEFTDALSKIVESLSTEGKKEQADAVKSFLEQGAREPDFLGVLSGAVEASAPPLPTTTEGGGDGIIETGNVALATRGAEALAEGNPIGLIDGIDSSDEGGWSSEGGSVQVNLAKVYKLSKIYFHLPTRGSETTYNYIAEVSPDGAKWIKIAERMGPSISGYQALRFSAQPVKSIRLLVKQLENTKRFLVQELMAFCASKEVTKVTTTEDLQAFLCDHVWSYDRVGKESRTLTFIPNGKLFTPNWKGSYTILSPTEVAVHREDQKYAKELMLKFASDYKSYVGSDEEDEALTGKLKE